MAKKDEIVETAETAESELLETIAETAKTAKKADKSDKIFAELKAINDKLDSFELSEEEQETIIKDEIVKEESKQKPKFALFFGILGLFAVVYVLFGAKLNAKIEKKSDSSI